MLCIGGRNFMPKSESQMMDDFQAQLRALLLQINGHSHKPGIIQLLDGDEQQPGLIAQTYHVATLLKELLEQRESVADLFEPGELQDQKIARLRERLGAALSEESRRVTAPVVETIQSAAQEVLLALSRVRDEQSQARDSFSEIVETHDDQMETLNLRLEQVMEKIQGACDVLDTIADVDTDKLNSVVREATSKSFKEAMTAFRNADKEWLLQVLKSADEGLVHRMKDAIEGQNMVFESQFYKSRADLQKAIEGQTYADALKKLTSTLSEKEVQIAECQAELESLRNANQTRGGVSLPLQMAFIVAGSVCAGVAITTLLLFKFPGIAL